ncbi:MAG TPA: ABC transporter ATP-binding protein [Steroidobacteraceae bacterium]|nr:ABC transporter ATP-binding protein [Steroidobacteraceae bacterium]
MRIDCGAVLGIIRPDDRLVELFGQRVKRVTPSLKRRIGYVSQEPTFYTWMTAERLGRFVSSFYPTWDHQEFIRLLEVLDVPKDRRAAELSGGTRSKLGLALALAPRPELLLLDEPTAGLDPVARAEFNDQLVSLQRERGTTVFFSSHLVGEVEQLAQRVGIVQAGKTRFEGDVAALRACVRRIINPQSHSLEGFEHLRGDIYAPMPRSGTEPRGWKVPRCSCFPWKTSFWRLHARTARSLRDTAAGLQRASGTPMGVADY